jgi:hypothetical protein
LTDKPIQLISNSYQEGRLHELFEKLDFKAFDADQRLLEFPLRPLYQFARSLGDFHEFEKDLQAIYQSIATSHPELASNLILDESRSRFRGMSPFTFDLKPMVKSLETTLEQSFASARTAAEPFETPLFEYADRYRYLADATWHQGYWNYFKRIDEQISDMCRESREAKTAAQKERWYRVATPPPLKTWVILIFTLIANFAVPIIFLVVYGWKAALGSYLFVRFGIRLIFRIHRLIRSRRGEDAFLYSFNRARRWRFTEDEIVWKSNLVQKGLAPCLPNDDWEQPRVMDRFLIVRRDERSEYRFPRYFYLHGKEVCYELYWKNGKFFLRTPGNALRQLRNQRALSSVE